MNNSKVRKIIGLTCHILILISALLILIFSMISLFLPVTILESNRYVLFWLILCFSLILIISVVYLSVAYMNNVLVRLYSPISDFKDKCLINYNLKTKVVHINNQLKKMLNIKNKNLTLKEFKSIFVNPENLEFDYNKLLQTNMSISKLCTKNNQSIIFVFFPNKYKGESFVVGYAIDFTIQDFDQATLIKTARFDTLTGAYRRSYFIKNVKDKMSNQNSKGALVFMDIDNFKSINDKYGHTNGDVVLIKLSSVLKDFCLDKKVFFGRMGGDEFVIYFYDLKEYEIVYQYLKEIEIAIKTISFQNIGLKQIDISMGVSFFPLHSTNLDLLFKYVDESLYCSKCVPGTAFTIYNEGKVNEEFDTLDDDNKCKKVSFNNNDIFSGMALNDIEETLKKAFQRKEFLVYIQPEIALNNGSYKGECLVRWNSKEYGLVYPNSFIPYLERVNLITEFDYYMFNEVLELVEKNIKSDSKTMVAVNQSIKTMVDPEYENRIREIFNRHKITSGSVAIEISERAMFTGQRHINKAVDLFHSLGLKILIDDFGDGHTSLELLKDLDVDMVKIDRSFLSTALKDNFRPARIIKGIACICRELNVLTILEGIETKEQLKLALDGKIDYAQGFIFSSVVQSDVFFNSDSETKYKKKLTELINEIYGHKNY